MAQINNGKLDGEAVEDFDTPEEDPDIKGSPHMEIRQESFVLAFATLQMHLKFKQAIQ